jgi:hypothetical protein
MHIKTITKCVLLLVVMLSFSSCSSCGGSKDPNNTKLVELSLSVGALVPAFSPDVTEYTTEVPIITKELTVTATPEDEYATVYFGVNPVSIYLGKNTITIDVTSANKGHKETYTITVTRKMPDFPTFINPDDTVVSSENFGSSISNYEDTLVVGAPYQDNGAILKAGAVYVYKKTNGTWALEQKLISPVPAYEEFFGFSVSIVTNTIAIGAYKEDTTQTNSGAVYIFKRTGNTWNFSQTLKAPTPNVNGYFGYKTVIAGSELAISEPFAPNIDGTQNVAGRIHIYEEASGTWTFSTTIDGSTYAKANDEMGSSMAFNGLIIAAGAPNTLTWPYGKVYFFIKSSNTWSFAGLVPDPNMNPLYEFGKYISLSGSSVAVGVPNQSTGAVNSGAIYVCSLSGCATQPIKMGTPVANEKLGTGLFIYNDVIIAGAPGHNSNQGAIYAFAQDKDGLWSLTEGPITPDTVQSDENFGSVIIGNSTGRLIIGSPYWDSGIHSDAGACYISD